MYLFSIGRVLLKCYNTLVLVTSIRGWLHRWQLLTGVTDTVRAAQGAIVRHTKEVHSIVDHVFCPRVLL